MSRTTADARGWVQQGTAAFSRSIAGLDDEGVSAASVLPGWRRAHLIAHVAANAEALRNLAHWARTGEETPMYSSPGQRNQDIEDGARKSASDLIEWFESSAAALEADFDAMPEDAWAAEVRTAQGRTVPFSEVPWMRTREALVHAVDLDLGVKWDELPQDALIALIDDIVAKRSATDGNPALSLSCSERDHTWQVDGEGEPSRITAPVSQLAAYVAGRPTATSLTTDDGAPAPELPPWL